MAGIERKVVIDQINTVASLMRKWNDFYLGKTKAIDKISETFLVWRNEIFKQI
jgi:hypothetical protein